MQHILFTDISAVNEEELPTQDLTESAGRVEPCQEPLWWRRNSCCFSSSSETQVITGSWQLGFGTFTHLILLAF